MHFTLARTQQLSLFRYFFSSWYFLELVFVQLFAFAYILRILVCLCVCARVSNGEIYPLWGIRFYFFSILKFITIVCKIIFLINYMNEIVCVCECLRMHLQGNVRSNYVSLTNLIFLSFAFAYFKWWHHKIVLIIGLLIWSRCACFEVESLKTRIVTWKWWRWANSRQINCQAM